MTGGDEAGAAAGEAGGTVPAGGGAGDAVPAGGEAGGGGPRPLPRFVEAFANVLFEAGVPRMPARVFAAILATDRGRLTAAELADALQASPAAISGAVRYLTQVELLAREREPGSRRDVYVMRDDGWYEAIVRRERLLELWASALRAGLDEVGPDTPAGRRLSETLAFFEFLEEEMPALLARWRSRRPAAP
jgi:predicted transcriptional regulator